MPGQVSSAVDITAATPFTTAQVKLRFDPGQVPNGDYAGLRIVSYDETSRVFLPLDNQKMDAAAGYIWGDTTHFTTFVIFYIPNWNTAWTAPGSGGGGTCEPNQANAALDVMLVLDSSGSMSWNDPNGYRRIAAKSFIDGLLPGDRVGVVDFDSYGALTQSLTTDFARAKAAVDQIDDWGGTNIAAGIQLSNQELINNAAAGTVRVAILLTDGEGYYDNNLTTEAKNAGIVIYTIGLGSSVDASLLGAIAAGTGGMYFPVANAADLPQVFSRIADQCGNDDTTDSDGDSLTDKVETQGIRTGTGALIKTDHNNWDTDGDGLGDGDEAGAQLTGPLGAYYELLANPLEPDTDDDDLLDREELAGSTNVFLADSDGDGLTDGFETGASFDPLSANPDGDSRNDAEELAQGSDPFSYDRTGWDYAGGVIAGLIFGDAGENMANLGVLSQETLECLCYVAGWLASGFVAVGDIRDTLAALVRLDLVDTFLNAIAIIPLLGDGVKVAKVAVKYLDWVPHMGRTLLRWTARQFAEQPKVLEAIIKVFGWENIAGLAAKDIDELLRAGNHFDELAQLLVRNPDKFKFGTKPTTDVDWSQVDQAVNTNWNLPNGKHRARIYSWAKSTEAARQWLTAQGYDLLYVGSQAPINLPNGVQKSITQGPDIVAINPRTGKTVVIEVKGRLAAGAEVGREMVTSVVDKQPMIQNSYDWLATNANRRYLDTLLQATDPKIKQAGDRMNDIVNNGATYETIVFGAGKTPFSWGNDMMSVLNALDNRTTQVSIFKIDFP